MAETIHDGEFYLTGFYSYDDEGAPAVETGDLAIRYEAGVEVIRENGDAIAQSQDQAGIVLRHFRLVDEGPVLDELK